MWSDDRVPKLLHSYSHERFTSCWWVLRNIYLGIRWVLLAVIFVQSDCKICSEDYYFERQICWLISCHPHCFKVSCSIHILNFNLILFSNKRTKSVMWNEFYFDFTMGFTADWCYFAESHVELILWISFWCLKWSLVLLNSSKD